MNFFGRIRSLIMRIFPIKPTIKALNLQVPDMADIPELQGLWGSLYNGTPPFLKGKQKYLNIPRIVSFDVARLAVGEAQFSSNDKNADFILQTLIAPNIQQAVEQAVADALHRWMPELVPPGVLDVALRHLVVQHVEQIDADGLVP